MRVILLNPPTDPEQLYGDWDLSPLDTYTTPLGIMHIASFIREHGHEAQIIDLQVDTRGIGEITSQVQKFKPDVVGLSAMTINSVNANKIASAFKSDGIEAPIVLGGAHVTAVPIETMRVFESIDYGVLGEGEHTFLDLVEAIRDRRPVDSILGVTWRDNLGNVVVNEPRPYIEDLDSLPFPAWDLLSGFPDRYPSSLLESKRLPAAGIMTSRGCPFQCTFCDCRVFGSKVRHFSVEYSLGMIRHLIAEYGIRDLMFFDDNLLLADKKLYDICDRIVEERMDISWYCIAHAKSMTRERLEAIKRAGCWFVEMGIESGNESILKAIKKKTNKREIALAAENAHKAGLLTKGNFIFGLPGETADTLRETIDFALEIDIDLFQQSFLTVWPGCQIYSDLKESSKLAMDGVEAWGQLAHQRITHVPESLNSDEMTRLSKEAFRRFYLRPKIVFRLLPLMMTWRGFKLCVISFVVFLQTVLRRT